jgi:hypothetical protein
MGTLLCSCCRIPVLSQHTLNGCQSLDCDAIGQSQGGSFWKVPNLRRQVQNFAAHGMVGCFYFPGHPAKCKKNLSPTWKEVFLRLELAEADKKFQGKSRRAFTSGTCLSTTASARYRYRRAGRPSPQRKAAVASITSASRMRLRKLRLSSFSPRICS